MPIPQETLSAFEDTINRLAAESVLAQAGSDEGLIPTYSLIGELAEQASLEPVVLKPVKELHAKLEQRLDSALPFDEPTLTAVRDLVRWLPSTLAALKAGQPVPALGGGAVSAPAPSSQAVEAKPAPSASAPAGLDPSVDTLLDLHMEENQELLGEFHAEALDHLSQIEAALLTLDTTPDDRDALNSIFRSFHTIKGVSGFLQLKPMHILTHEVESLLDKARNNELRLTPTIITAVLQSRDAVQAMVQQITRALETGQQPDEIIPVSHLIRTVKLLAANPVAVPAPQPVAPPPVVAVPVPAPVAAQTPTPAPAVAAATPSSPVVAAEEPVAAAKTASAPKAGGAVTPPGVASTVRVNTEKLDGLMDVVGELVIVQSQLVESARAVTEDGSPLQRNVAQLGRITKDLQHTSMSLRMVPVKPTFQKMERLARDLARDFGKKVTFVTSGDETEVDRTVVEEIADPLVHMVRNSLDHGLETPAERLAAGKSENGTLQLKAYHQGSNIIIELTDDGHGIDPAKVLAKARQNKLVPENAQYPKEEILNFIFLPGFSTAEKVTAVSGRGVGMDVVRRNIEKLRGKVEVDSEVGRGTIFRIKLPLTMAIIDGLVVRVGVDRFILPSTSVQMALRPEKGMFSSVHGRGELMDHRGRIIPLHRLHRRFGITGAIEDPWDGIVVIVEANGRVAALLVDEMVSKQEVVIKNLGAFLQGMIGVAGGAILGDGNIALILDPASLFATGSAS